MNTIDAGTDRVAELVKEDQGTVELATKEQVPVAEGTDFEESCTTHTGACLFHSDIDPGKAATS